jgi:hypothetical protein
MVGGMVRNPVVMRRRLREGMEFFQFLRQRRRVAGLAGASSTTDG